nr:MAG TPA: hypothetical protein [Caudoviricetes sp.]
MIQTKESRHISGGFSYGLLLTYQGRLEMANLE